MDVLILSVILLSIYAVQRLFISNRMEALNQHQRSSDTTGFVDFLLFWHLIIAVGYYLYGNATATDSKQYYRIASSAASWFELWGQDTKFIHFLAWPFASGLGLSYNALMLLFAFLGFQGVLLFYLSAKENIKSLPVVWGNFSLAEFIFILPNIHFWSSSLGKGSVILFGIGLVMYGLSRYNNRIPLIITGAVMVYMTRPHIMFVILLGVGLAIVFAGSRVKTWVKFLMVGIAIVVSTLISDALVQYSGTENLNIFESEFLQKRARDLGDASSGVDISNYNQVQKVLTFLYRPLFFDASGAFGILSSMENLLLLVISLYILFHFTASWRKLNGWFRILIVVFFLGSLALAQVTGNLGLAMRQKAQLMPLIFIIFLKIYEFRHFNPISR